MIPKLIHQIAPANPVIFFAYAHAREGKASKSASFARVAIC
jgi:hypothetical protein